MQNILSKSSNFKSLIIKLVRVVKLLSIWILLMFIILEIFLRIYTPISFSTIGNKIQLNINDTTQYEHTIKHIPQSPIKVTNNIGFQGRNFDPSINNFKIFAVGGSTTNCDLIQTNHSWPNLLDSLLTLQYPCAWLNNAGMSGHTTFGHQILLEDILIKLKPNVILFLMGANDRGINELSIKDTYMFKPRYSLTKLSWKGEIYFYLLDKSKVFAFIHNIRRSVAAKNKNLFNYKGTFDPENMEKTQKINAMLLDTILQNYKILYIPEFKNRVERLVQTCESNNILPVLITQPIIYDNIYDSTYQIDLSTIKSVLKYKVFDDERNLAIDGLTEKAIMDLHNKAILEVSSEKNVPTIDLASQMPKGFKYFYDPIHFTSQGCNQVAKILANEINKLNIIKPDQCIY